MHEINQSTITFFAASWVIAFCAAFCRYYGEIGDKPFGNVMASCGMCGFLGFSVSVLLANGIGAVGGSSGLFDWVCLASAAVTGIAAKDPDKMAVDLFNRLTDGIRVLVKKKGDDPPE